jgi:hypothetical protein
MGKKQTKKRSDEGTNMVSEKRANDPSKPPAAFHLGVIWDNSGIILG